MVRCCGAGGSEALLELQAVLLQQAVPPRRCREAAGPSLQQSWARALLLGVVGTWCLSNSMGLATRHAGPRRDYSRLLWLSFFSQGLQSLGKALAVAPCKKSAVCPGSQGQRVPAAVTPGSRSRPFWAWPVSRCNLQVCSLQSTVWLSTMDCWQHTAGSRLLQECCSASHALCLWSLMPCPALEDDFIKGHQDNCLLRGTLFCAEAR